MFLFYDMYDDSDDDNNSNNDVDGDNDEDSIDNLWLLYTLHDSSSSKKVCDYKQQTSV